MSQILRYRSGRPVPNHLTTDSRVAFDRRVRREYRGTQISSEGGLLVMRERDDAHHPGYQPPSSSANARRVTAIRTPNTERNRLDRSFRRAEKRLGRQSMTPSLGLKRPQPDVCARPAEVRREEMPDRTTSSGDLSIMPQSTCRMLAHGDGLRQARGDSPRPSAGWRSNFRSA